LPEKFQRELGVPKPRANLSAAQKARVVVLDAALIFHSFIVYSLFSSFCWISAALSFLQARNGCLGGFLAQWFDFDLVLKKMKDAVVKDTSLCPPRSVKYQVHVAPSRICWISPLLRQAPYLYNQTMHNP
jgi:hypothetical protein